jgi:hypothetical protein
MPCFTTSRMSVDFKAEHFDLLEEAVKELGYGARRNSNSLTFYTSNGTVTIRDGKINLDDRDRKIIDPLKRAYSKEVLRRASSRYGWALKKTAENTFVVNKR